MNKETVKLLLNTSAVGLGAAGIILILLSVFAEMNTLKWGLLCVALGSILCFIRILQKSKTP